MCWTTVYACSINTNNTNNNTNNTNNANTNTNTSSSSWQNGSAGNQSPTPLVTGGPSGLMRVSVD